QLSLPAYPGTFGSHVWYGAEKCTQPSDGSMTSPAPEREITLRAEEPLVLYTLRISTSLPKVSTCEISLQFSPKSGHSYQARYLDTGDQCGLAIEDRTDGQPVPTIKRTKTVPIFSTSEGSCAPLADRH